MMKSNIVPNVTSIVPAIIFFETFSPKNKIAIIVEKIGVLEVKGATMFMLVVSNPKYNRLSPIPKPINPLNNANNN